MVILIAQDRKYRIGDLAGVDPFWTISIDKKTIGLEVLRRSSAQPATTFIRAGGRVMSISIQRDENQHIYSVEVSGRPLTVTLEEDASSGPTGGPMIIDGPAVVDSPMAGKIASVKTFVNSKVEEGQPLMVLEAMKMQNEIASPKTGTVKELFVRQGDLVKAGDKLCLVD
jgi:biotin carboxyl carrier protein